MNEEIDDLLLLYVAQKSKQKKRRIWVHEMLQRRAERGEAATTIVELSSFEDKFYEYFRMSQQQFEGILALVKDDPRLCKKTTNFREPISARDRLALCLR